MTSEQLQNTRTERWRQASNPILTSDDAAAWMEGIGLCLFLPRRAHFSAHAPSFVEAVAGAPSEAPGREAIESATALLQRLTADAKVVPLNLFVAAGGGASDQPDFLVTREALPYVFSLISGRNWKSGPGAKASPLMTEIWTLLNNKLALTAQEIQATLGRELTEGAVLRGLVELWNGLRAIPVYDGEKTRWELTQARFAAELTASQKVAQTTALSALVSLYLDAVVAASSEEIETFLSPLASRTRVREVVNGLLATRQLGLISVGAQPLLHVAGSLPEFAEPEPQPREILPHREYQQRPASESPGARLERRPRPTGERGPARKPFERGGRERLDRGRDKAPRERTESGRPGPARRFSARSEGPSGPKTERPYRRAEGGADRKPFDRGERKPSEREGGKDFRRREDRRPFPKPFRREERFAAGGRSQESPGKERGGFGRKPFGARRDERDKGRPPFRKERDERGFGGGNKFGARKPGKSFGGANRFGARGPIERKVGREGESGEKRPFFRDRGARPEGGPRREFKAGERKGPQFEKRGFEKRGPEKREAGWKPKGGSAKTGRPSFGRPDERTFRKNEQSFPKKSRPEVDRPGLDRPRLDRPGSDRPGFDRKRKPDFRSQGRANFDQGKRGDSGKSGKPFGKARKPFEKSGKPFGKAGKSFEKSPRPFGKSKPGFKKVGKPAFGARKPGGFKPPFRKRKSEGNENAE